MVKVERDIARGRPSRYGLLLLGFIVTLLDPIERAGCLRE